MVQFECPRVLLPTLGLAFHGAIQFWGLFWSALLPTCEALSIVPKSARQQRVYDPGASNTQNVK